MKCVVLSKTHRVRLGTELHALLVCWFSLVNASVDCSFKREWQASVLVNYTG